MVGRYVHSTTIYTSLLKTRLLFNKTLKTIRYACILFLYTLRWAQLGEFYSAILSDFISSYRKFYSCETALLRLTEDWRRMCDRGNWLQ